MVTMGDRNNLWTMTRKAGFERYLVCERALAGSTAAAHVSRALCFLPGVNGGGLADLTAGDATRAVLAEAEMVCRRTERAFTMHHQLAILLRRPLPRRTAFSASGYDPAILGPDRAALGVGETQGAPKGIGH